MINHRRQFIAGLGASLTLTGIAMPAYTKDLSKNRIAVIILEGGLDGLHTVLPIGDKDFLGLRDELLAANPYALNRDFALHPALGNFAKMLGNDEAAIIHATNIPYTKRSHFEGQNLAETGDTRPFYKKTGWLGLALDMADLTGYGASINGAANGRVLSLGIPLIARGHQDIDNFYPANIRGSLSITPEFTQELEHYHHGVIKDAFHKIGQKYQQKDALNVPRDPVSLAQYAGNVMAKDDGPVASVIRVKDFDTHARQGNHEGRLSNNLQTIDNIFLAYKQGLGDKWRDTIILTVTEFGRTVKVNGSNGTDHGYGTTGLLAGGLLKKSTILADWPGLSKRNMFEERDLLATIDYRAIMAACLEACLHLPHDRIANEIFETPALARYYDQLFV